MHGVGVGGGMHRDGCNAELLARAQDAQGNLAAIGYQDLVEHRYCLFRHPEERALARLEGRRSVRQFNKFILRGSGFALAPPAITAKPLRRDDARPYSIITSGSPNSTGWPSSTRICVTVPARGDGIWFIVFMASMINSVCPTETLAPTSMNGFAPGSGAQ